MVVASFLSLYIMDMRRVELHLQKEKVNAKVTSLSNGFLGIKCVIHSGTKDQRKCWLGKLVS